jgi:hypothetical protein
VLKALDDLPNDRRVIVLGVFRICRMPKWKKSPAQSRDPPIACSGLKRWR